VKIQVSILDMADPLKPYLVLQTAFFADDMKYPVMNMFTLPATMDARVMHPYALVVEEIKTS